ncbi:hypothetical protein OG21DRAFT_1509435 [Imleria badia]|nr:hypothetical protein OG21DRAFT_1509435 [Imleria badia]
MAAAAVSLACPLRRSTRLAHAHPRRTLKLQRHNPEPDNEPDSSSSDPENELTPRALRALKRQRLPLDPDGLPCTRARKRRKDTLHRPSTQPLAPRRTLSSDGHPHPPSPTDSYHGAPTAYASPSSIPENRPSSPSHSDVSKPELSIPLPPRSPDPSSPFDSEPLTPLTPLTPSPESSPSLPGHDRQASPISPPHDPLPPLVSLDTLPMPEPAQIQQQSSADSFTPPPLDPALNTLIPFDGLHPQFDPELSVQIPPPPTPPQLQGLELQAQFHSFPQHQLYVPPNPVFVRDREINIWKLACQERVDCLLRRYGIDYIKALVESQARSVSRSSPISGNPSQTKFRLYTPASYTYSLSSWGSPSGTRKAFPVDDQGDDADPGWPMDDADADWADADVDMEDEDEDDYEDEDETGEAETVRDSEATLEGVEGLVIADTGPPKPDTQSTAAMNVDSTGSDDRPTTKATASSEPPVPPRSAPDLSPRPSTPVPHPFPSPPLLTPPTLPPLSSLHVPLLSEPPRAFMGRGTPPDRRRLVEWSDSARFASNGMGPPLYLSPVPQRHVSADVGIIPMSVDPPLHHPAPPQPLHTHGEWTSFLYSMLEGDGVGVGVGIGTSVGGAGHASEPTWYELGLASVPPVVTEPALALPHTHARTPTGAAVDQPVDEGSNSSSTLRFALG